MRMTKKYKCIESNTIVSGMRHAIQCDLYDQLIVIFALRERQLFLVVITFPPIYMLSDMIYKTSELLKHKWYLV